MRASRLDGDLEDDSVPQEGDTINAYVISTNKKGCFLRISRSIEGRVILKELADGYLHDPEALFPMGRLVIGKVKTVNAGKQKGKQKLAAMLDIDMRESQLLKDEGMLKLEDVKINEKYRGIVSRVEDYGVHVKLEHSEVCGLVHKSECSDGFIKEVKELYDPGDLVKVLVIKVDMDRRKIGLSMKASHFEGDVDSDDDISLEDSDAEKMDTDEDEDDSDSNSDDENYVSKLAKKMGGGSSNEADVGDSDSGSSDEESEGIDDKLKGDDDESDDSSTSTGGELDSKEVMDTDVGFQWDAVPTDDKEVNESSSDESDDDMEDDDDDEDAPGKSSHNSRKKAASRRREEEEVSKREKALADGTADANPETAADYERLLASDPNNSEQWIRFMAFYLSLADMEGCRRVAKRALERIDFRQEGDKLNIWTALMTMELKFGGDFESTVENACQQSNPKHVYLRACEILQKSGSRTDRVEGLYEKMCKRFRSKKSVWLAYLTYLLKLGRHHDAHALLKRALLSLPQYKHVETMSKLAQLEFEYGSRERGRTVFDGILSKYPKRLDILFVFVDKEIKCGELKAVRSLLKKTAETNSKLNDKQMKKLFRKWMKIEEEFGDAETVETVKDAARAYVERTSK
jgi:rRNA biogenesis protein RRP5